MIEAMACGTPVVALDHGSVPEIVEHGVNGFTCQHPDELPAAIRDTKRLDPADCRKRAEERFDTSIMVSRYERLYRQAVTR